MTHAQVLDCVHRLLFDIGFGALSAIIVLGAYPMEIAGRSAAYLGSLLVSSKVQGNVRTACFGVCHLFSGALILRL